MKIKEFIQEKIQNNLKEVTMITEIRVFMALLLLLSQVRNNDECKVIMAGAIATQ